MKVNNPISPQNIAVAKVEQYLKNVKTITWPPNDGNNNRILPKDKKIEINNWKTSNIFNLWVNNNMVMDSNGKMPIILDYYSTAELK